MRSKAHLLKRRMPNAQTRAAMKEARAMQKARSARFATADELFDDLNDKRHAAFQQLREFAPPNPPVK